MRREGIRTSPSLRTGKEAREKSAEATASVQWSSSRSSSEAFLAFPLAHRGQIAGVLLAGTSLAAQLTLENEILWIGVVAAVSGILIGILLGWWTTERVTRPVTQLARGARAVANGDWSARVEVISKDEIGELATAFNRMTEQLAEQRDRAIQAERVAAWRELARRLAQAQESAVSRCKSPSKICARRENDPSSLKRCFRNYRHPVGRSRQFENHHRAV